MQFTIGRKRKLMIGENSQCGGYGLFANEVICEGEYIGEYIGELTSDKAANERDLIYDEVEVTYMFMLNSFFVLDSWEFGNKLRYANHSTKDSNCVADIIYACGQYKVVLKATKNIKRFNEILFDYKLTKKYKWLQDFNKKTKK
jgi:SET domain-containing protein